MNRTFLPLVAFIVLGGTSVLAFRPAPTPAEMADLDKQIAADPGNSRLLQYQGLCYAILGKKDKAIADYKAAQKISPTQSYLYWSYGWAMFDLGEYSTAIQAWQSAAVLYKNQSNSDLQWVPYTLALAYWGEGDKKDAFEYYTISAKRDAAFRDRTEFEAYTDRWTQKEQTMALQLFDAWQREVERPGSHLW